MYRAVVYHVVVYHTVFNFMYFLYLILFVKIEPALFLPAGTGGILNAYFFHAWWAKFDG